MKRVVVTGMGIISCLGNDCDSVAEALKTGKSGIQHVPQYQELGMRSHVAGVPTVDIEASIDRKVRRFMGDAAAFAYLAAQQAIADANLSEELLNDPKVGLVAGSGGASSANQVLAADLLREKGLKKVGPYMVTRTMSSTVSACLATALKITGMNYSISSACATSAHCIGHGMEMIQLGKQDVVLAGGGEELDWTLSSLFDAMGALSTKYNETPERASRPYDSDRDGFVIAGGAGMLVLESLEHAQARGATIYAELIGYGRTSDGADMVAPNPAGPARCMQQALATVEDPIDYINAHGTSTPKGDLSELNAIRMAFPNKVPPVSSTKSLSGHSLGAAGVQEAIYTLLMQRHGFIAPTINVENLDENAADIDIVTSTREAKLDTVLSNSFGFGGTNASLVFKRWQG
jgi:3-oxoacyl-[acyl-carrier-protein] synthase-1